MNGDDLNAKNEDALEAPKVEIDVSPTTKDEIAPYHSPMTDGDNAPKLKDFRRSELVPESRKVPRG